MQKQTFRQVSEIDFELITRKMCCEYTKNKSNSNYNGKLLAKAVVVSLPYRVFFFFPLCMCVNFDLLFSYTCNLSAKRNK